MASLTEWGEPMDDLVFQFCTQPEDKRGARSLRELSRAVGVRNRQYEELKPPGSSNFNEDSISGDPASGVDILLKIIVFPSVTIHTCLVDHPSSY